MSKQVFALDVNNTQRIIVHWAIETESATVLLNGTILGTLNTAEEKVGGKDFILPDHSPLHVQFFNGYPQAYRHGVPLPPVLDVDDVPVKQRKRGGCLTAFLIFHLILMTVLTLFYFLGAVAALVHNNVSAHLVLMFLLFGIVGFVGIAGISLLLAWKKLGFYLVAGYVFINMVISVSFGFIEGKTFIPLLSIAILYFWLNRSGVWEQLK